MIPASSKPPLPIATILDLWAEGKDTQDIAHALGVKEHEIYNAMSRLGNERTENRNRIIAFKARQPE